MDGILKESEPVWKVSHHAVPTFHLHLQSTRPEALMSTPQSPLCLACIQQTCCTSVPAKPSCCVYVCKFARAHAHKLSFCWPGQAQRPAVLVPTSGSTVLPYCVHPLCRCRIEPIYVLGAQANAILEYCPRACQRMRSKDGRMNVVSLFLVAWSLHLSCLWHVDQCKYLGFYLPLSLLQSTPPLIKNAHCEHRCSRSGSLDCS